MSNIIRIIGPIDENAYKSFSEELDKFGPKTPTIHVELSSGGGTGYDALAFYSKLTRHPAAIHITAIGLVASAAVLILAAGHTRKMCREAWVMVHEDTCKIKGDVVHLEREIAHYRQMEDQWCKLLAARTKTSSQEWSILHKKTTYLSAQECLELGLVDEII